MKTTTKYLRSRNLCTKPYLTICFKPLLLMKGFEDFILIFYYGVLNTTLHVNMETKLQYKQHFATTYRR